MHAATNNISDWLPSVHKPVGEWTASERFAVIANRQAWIQRCMDQHNEELKIKKFLTFLQGKINGTN